MLVAVAAAAPAPAQSLPDGAIEPLEARLYGPPASTAAEWFAPAGPASNPLGFLLRPWASPKDVCLQTADGRVLTEEGESGGEDEIFCYWLFAPTPASTVFFQATGSPADTWYVRFKLTVGTEPFAEEASALSALVRDFHVERGWIVPPALPSPVSVDDISFEARGIQYRFWREDADTPRLNLTMIFPDVGLSSTAFSR